MISNNTNTSSPSAASPQSLAPTTAALPPLNTAFSLFISSIPTSPATLPLVTTLQNLTNTLQPFTQTLPPIPEIAEAPVPQQPSTAHAPSALQYAQLPPAEWSKGF